MGLTACRFLLDSGAAVSVVRLDATDKQWHDKISAAESNTTVAADGLPLEVVGQVTLPVSLGNFKADQEFTVVQSLTVDCILGADFLVKHCAVIDCNTATLTLGSSSRSEVLISLGRSGNSENAIPQEIFAVLSGTLELPARSVCEIGARVMVASGQEGLVEPLEHGSLPKHLLIARTLTSVGQNGAVILQVTNNSPSPITIYKGSKLGKFIPREYICLLETTNTGSDQLGAEFLSAKKQPPLNVDLTSTGLTPTEKQQLLALLTQFSDLFATTDRPLGKTEVVKHAVKTSGPPIRQPLRRIPEALKEVVQQEVQKMLKQGVISPSDSPWSSPIVMVRKQDGSWRFCVDYRKVNSVTKRDAYPLPRIAATLD